jgi:hypothetical protein
LERAGTERDREGDRDSRDKRESWELHEHPEAELEVAPGHADGCIA